MSTNLPFSESEHAWHRILRGPGHGDIASSIASHRLVQPPPAPPEAPNQLQEPLAYPSSACHGQMPQDRLGIAWFRKGPAGGLAEYVGELS